MERSEYLNELAAALCRAQAEMDDAEKVKANPAFRSKYADLGAVWDAAKPALTKHGLSVAQFCEPGPDGTLMLTTMLLHASGQFISGTAMLPLAKQDPQGYGSALTYARRYGLAAMVGVCPEDDDGNAASHRQERPQQRQEAPQRPANPPRTQQAVQASEKGNAYSYETGARQPAPPKEEAEELQMAAPAPTGALVCAWDGCGASLTKGQHDISLRAYGHPLCPAHQKEARERA
jgi:hypothetical protein